MSHKGRRERIQGSGGDICRAATNLKIELRQEKNIISNNKQIGREGVDCIHLAQDEGKWHTLVSTRMKLWIL